MGSAVSFILAGGAMQAVSAYQQSEAAERAAKINASRVAQESAEQQLELHERMKTIAGQNRTIIAKSGVRSEGSPNSVLAANELKTLRQQRRIQRRAEIERTQFRNQARSARYAGGMGVASSLLSTTGRSLLSRDNPLAASLLS
tara:strand:- start:383 stop:814 length:432 start_codon:yes stop_codon:yes gene_type:complete